MLETKDLQQIGQILDEKLDPIKKDLTSLKTDVGSLKTDVGALKIGLSSLTTDVNSLAMELADVKVTVERIDKRTDEDVAVAFGEIERLQTRVSTIEEQLRV